MLVKINKQDKSKSKYKCDKCKKHLTTDTRYIIYIKEPEKDKVKKSWDLCEKDYEMIRKFIIKRYSEKI